jgi:glucose-6-phosphate-specific signal transduction histidine kinase
VSGCSNPRTELRREAEKLKKQQLEQDLVLMEEQLYDDISLRLSDNIGERVVDNSTLFSNSKLISELESDSKYLTDVKKKKFMRDHL